MSNWGKLIVLIAVVLAVSGIACATNSVTNQEIADLALSILEDGGYEAQVLVDGNHFTITVEAFNTESAFGTAIGCAAGIIGTGPDDSDVTICIKDAYTGKTSVVELDHKTGKKLYHAGQSDNYQEMKGILENLHSKTK